MLCGRLERSDKEAELAQWAEQTQEEEEGNEAHTDETEQKSITAEESTSCGR